MALSLSVNLRETIGIYFYKKKSMPDILVANTHSIATNKESSPTPKEVQGFFLQFSVAISAY